MNLKKPWKYGSVKKWFNIVREQKAAISIKMVQEKSLEYAKEMGLNDFAASDGWLENFDFKAHFTFCNHDFKS